MKVLLIDDNPIDLMIHQKLVQRTLENVTIEKVMSGEAAIEFLDTAEQLPDIVLLDIKMPIMNGFEFLEAIKTRDYIKKLIIYMVSSSIDPKDIQMAEESDMVKAFLEKPLTMEAILKIKA